MTLSFVPDGTAVASETSTLFQSLNAYGSPSQWQEEILRAFQTWAIEANIDIGLVPDGGIALGSLGLKQGDPRVGDIRIGAYSMANDILASANPYNPFVADTWGGDVFLNSAESFSPGGVAAEYDLFSVMLHEAGHSLGIGHSQDPASPMFANVSATPVAGLTTGDAAAIRVLYGSRRSDAFDEAGGNDTLATATLLNATDTSAGWRSIVNGDLTTSSDVDVYRITWPSDAPGAEIRLSAAGKSLLTARMTLLDAAGNVIATTETKDPTDNNLRFTSIHWDAGETYYVRVEKSQDNAFAIGKYELTLQSGPSQSIVPCIVDLNGSSPSPAKAAQITAAAKALETTPGYVEHTYYEEYGTLDSNLTSQTYRVRSADIDPAIHNVFTMLVAAESNTASRVQVRLLDDQGHIVNTNVVYRTDGVLEVQAASVVSNRDYFVEIASSSLSMEAIGYELTVDFDQDGAHLLNYVSDWLNSEQNVVNEALIVRQGSQFHFVLSASDFNNRALSGVSMSITDGAGRAVFSLAADEGAARGADVFLDHGNYTVRFTSVSGTPAVPLLFQLSGLVVSDPIGPQLSDTTLQPREAAVDSALSQLSYYWLPFHPAPAVVVSPNPGILSLNFVAAGNSTNAVTTPSPANPTPLISSTGSTRSVATEASAVPWPTNYSRRTGSGNPGQGKTARTSKSSDSTVEPAAKPQLEKSAPTKSERPPDSPVVEEFTSDDPPKSTSTPSKALEELKNEVTQEQDADLKANNGDTDEDVSNALDDDVTTSMKDSSDADTDSRTTFRSWLFGAFAAAIAYRGRQRCRRKNRITTDADRPPPGDSRNDLIQPKCI